MSELILRLTTRRLNLTGRTLVMGIINLNPDSFAGDGTLDLDLAMAKARAMVAAGADLIDVGGESARTNRGAIAEQEEIDRVVPFLELLRAEFGALLSQSDFPIAITDGANVFPPVLSINTWRPAVAEAALLAGAEILNDMSGLPTNENARIAARHGAALAIMHSVGEPKVAHTHVRYNDVMRALEDFFREKISLALAAGLPRENILFDPGIDFAKQRDDNLRIFRELDRLRQFERPILLPASRKTVIGDVLDLPEPADRDAGTIACIVAGMSHGASIFRVHNVAAAVQAARIVQAASRDPSTARQV